MASKFSGSNFLELAIFQAPTFLEPEQPLLNIKTINIELCHTKMENIYKT
jgi:hypothetical protein